jgi:PadR family transcriptional regulator, regulatory protein PadR
MRCMTEPAGAPERESLLLRGALDTCVMTLLAREPMHAYAVTQRLADHGFTQTGYGTVYPLVTRLRRLGLLERRAETGQGGPARHVLSVTADGHATLTRWRTQWHDAVGRVSGVLNADLEEERHVG